MGRNQPVATGRIGQYRPVKATAGFSTWQPAMLAQPDGRGKGACDKLFETTLC